MERKDFEIRTNIKFLVRLGWKGTDIIQALETVYGDRAPKKTCVYNGLEDLKKAEKLLNMKKAVEDQQPQDMMKMLILLGAWLKKMED